MVDDLDKEMGIEDAQIVPVREGRMVVTPGESSDMPTFNSDAEVNRYVDQVRRKNEAITKITELAIQQLYPSDFTMFGKTLYLEGHGCVKLKKYFGISVMDMERIPLRGLEILESDTAKRQRVTYRATFKMGQMLDVGFGECDTHFKLLGKTSEGYKEVDNIEITHMEGVARTKMYRDGISRLLGLSGITLEQLKDLGFDTSKIGKVEFKGGSQGGNKGASDPETVESKHEIAMMLMSMSNDDKEIAADMLERYTQWETKDKKKMKGKRSVKLLTENQVKYNIDKIRDDYHEHLKAQKNQPAEEAPVEVPPELVAPDKPDVPPSPPVDGDDDDYQPDLPF